MNIGEINKGIVALLLVLLLGAGGYLWYTQLYTPAVATRDAAKVALTTAEAGRNAAQQELAEAQQRIEDGKKASAKLDDSVARLSIGRGAIPDKQLLDDAAIVLMDLAARSGVRTTFKAGDDGETGAAPPAEGSGNLQGATPIDLTFEAAGTYAEAMQFMSLVEGTVYAKDSKLYARGRLFNIVKLEVGEQDDESESDSSFGGDVSESDGLVARDGEIVFTVVVRMYTSTAANAQDVGAATADDPAASATAGAEGGATTSTDPAAGGASGATGDAGAAGTDPSAAASGTGAPATDTAAATGSAGETSNTAGGF